MSLKIENDSDIDLEKYEKVTFMYILKKISSNIPILIVVIILGLMLYNQNYREIEPVLKLVSDPIITQLPPIKQPKYDPDHNITNVYSPGESFVYKLNIEKTTSDCATQIITSLNSNDIDYFFPSVISAKLAGPFTWKNLVEIPYNMPEGEYNYNVGFLNFCVGLASNQRNEILRVKPTPITIKKPIEIIY